MKKRLVSLLTALALVFTMSGAPVSAASVSTVGIQSCSQAYLILWEHVGFNGRGLKVCYPTNIPNLSTYNFNNITSSAQYSETPASGITVCVYNEPSYLFFVRKFATNGDSQQWFIQHNDTISSVRWNC